MCPCSYAVACSLALFSCSGDVCVRSCVGRDSQYARRNNQFRAHSAVDETVMVWMVKAAEDERRRMKVGSMCLVLQSTRAGHVAYRGAGAKVRRASTFQNKGPSDLSHVIACLRWDTYLLCDLSLFTGETTFHALKRGAHLCVRVVRL